MLLQIITSPISTAVEQNSGSISAAQPLARQVLHDRHMRLCNKGEQDGNLVQVDLEGARPGKHKAHEELSGDLHQLSALPQSSTSAGAVATCTPQLLHTGSH